MRTLFSICIGLLTVSAIPGQRPSQHFIENILRQSKHPVMHEVLAAPDRFHYQFIYEQIDRDKKGRPHFTRHTFQLDPDLYFYPASTVKMANALVALEKLNELGLSPWLTIHTDSARHPQQRITIDYSAKDLIPTIGHYIEMVFAVSDNEASNRLYEFIGQEELHKRLAKRGIKNTRIVHRLGNGRFSPDDNRFTNPVYLLDGADTVYRQAEREAKRLPPLTLRLTQRGKGYMDANDSLIYKPFDFSKKNFFPLADQVAVLKAILFPESLPSSKRFNLDSSGYQLLRRSMALLPRDTEMNDYDTTHYYDSYVKFFMFGDSHAPIPEHIKIYNKVGWAYGFMTEAAYIVDTKNGVEFILAGTVLANKNEIFNDNQYEFGKIGTPFLAEAGRMIYGYELQRKRK